MQAKLRPLYRVHVRGGGRCSEQFKTLLNRKKTHSFLNKSCVTNDSESIEKNFAYFGSAAFVPGHAAEVGVVFPARRLRHGVMSPGPRVPDSHERNSPSAPLLWRGGEEHPMNDTVRFLRVVSLPAGRRLRPKPRVPGKAKTAPRAETPQRRRRASNRTRCSMTSPQLRSQSHSRDMVT